MDGYVYSDTFKFVFSEELYKRHLENRRKFTLKDYHSKINLNNNYK